MEKMIDLRDLLKHGLMDLYSAEEQIIEALPLMIDKANNDKLKTALKEHLKVTEKQKMRLEEIQKLIGETEAETNAEVDAAADTETDAGTTNKPGFFSRLFGGGAEQKCKGMEGLISEGAKMMEEDMAPEVLDAAIIAGAQKIEHYEICGYGTARAFARELNLEDVAKKLEETLNEEYFADDLLTELAVGKLNAEAEVGEEPENKGRSLRTGQATSKANPKGRGGSANSNDKGTPAKGSKGSNAKASAGANGRSGSGKSKAAPGKSSSSSSRSSSSKSSAPSKTSASRSSGKASASKGRGNTSKSNSPAKKGNNSRGGSNKSSGNASSGKSSLGNRGKSSASKGSRR